MNWAEERSTLPGVFVSLCEVPPPISDDASTIRCRCSRGCRRRCTLGRRLPCSSCGSMVGSCCGSRSASAASPRNNGPSHVIVCHVCLGDRLEYQCQWDVRLSDFPVMTADAWFRWQRTSRRAEEQRAFVDMERSRSRSAFGFGITVNVIAVVCIVVAFVFVLSKST